MTSLKEAPRGLSKPRTRAGRCLLRWIDAGATDDRMIYAVVKNGPTVGDLRAAIVDIEDEAVLAATHRRLGIRP